MDTQKTRHEIEYEWIPEAAYSDKEQDFVKAVLMKKHELFLDLYKLWNSYIPRYRCPYTAEDFKVDATLIGNVAGILRVTMPPVLKDGDMIRLYICHDVDFQKVRLYSIVIDADGDTCFLTWVDDSHYKNHGKFSISGGEELRTVQDFYMKYLGSL